MANISLRNVSLDYPLYGAYDFSIKRRLLGRLAGNPGTTQTIRAIDNVSIEAAPGVRIGLAGPNGSGKSTLLRLIAGVYPATSGQIETTGNIMPLLGLIETPRRPPNSITEAVLAKNKGSAVALPVAAAASAEH